jgi:ATP-binding cassette, subfamily B, bacterial
MFLMKDLIALIKFVFPFWKKYWKQEGLIGMVLVLLLICQLAIPLQFKNSIDFVFIYSSIDMFIMSLFYLSLLMVISSGFTWAFQVIAASVGESIIIDITSRTYNFVLTQRRSFWQKFYAEDVLTRLTQDILAVKSFSVDLFHTVILQGVSMVAFVAVLIYFSVKVGLLILLFIPMIFALAYWGDRYLNKNATRVRMLASRFTGIFRIGIWNPPINYSWDLLRFHKNAYHNLAENMKRAQVGFVNQTQIVGQSISIVNILVATIGVLYLLYFDYQAGLFTTGQVFALIMYAGRATQSTTGLAGVFAMSKIERVSVLRILELLSFKSPDTKNLNLATDTITHPFFKGGLVTGIRLPDEKTFISRLNAENGAGKTTLSQVLSGYDDLGNNIVNVRWFLLPSDPPVFPGTLSDNIRIIAGKNVSIEDIHYILHKYNLSELLSVFPNGLSTWVSNNSVLISRGQKQVSALIGAIIKDPSLLFIDEGFNSIDAKLKEAIKDPLSIWLSNRKVIVVDHNGYLETAVTTSLLNYLYV